MSFGWGFSCFTWSRDIYLTRSLPSTTDLRRKLSRRSLMRFFNIKFLLIISFGFKMGIKVDLLCLLQVLVDLFLKIVSKHLKNAQLRPLSWYPLFSLLLLFFNGLLLVCIRISIGSTTLVFSNLINSTRPQSLTILT